MDTRARHVLVDLWGCDPAVLDDVEELRAVMRAAVVAAGSRAVAETTHRYVPQGVSVLVAIEESHMSLHTWPEAAYAAADFYTCGSATPERAVEALREGVRAERLEVLTVERGLGPPASLRVRAP
ncbi:MAG: adenosylmethionine decarboxylase [Polyangiaceae bacterium]|nr:adenosylmethionine decarboxylase [Polyangiaceae bacterium]